MGLLLFVKKKYMEQIRSGAKRYEIRAGKRYRHVRAGDTLSLNGTYRITVRRVETHQNASRLPSSASECHPGHEGPFYVFHF